MKTALITGITGQDGAYLSKLLLSEGYKVIGLTRSYNHSNLSRLQYVGILNDITIEECDLLDMSSLLKVIFKYGPSEIYNLAAQSSVGLSFEQPIGTIHFNIISVVNLLECIKLTGKDIKFYQASSSEMYGKVDQLPISENTVFHPISPYGISKAAAHWTVVNYRESYGIYACCGILFNHESALRSETFFVKKVIREAIKISRGQQDTMRVGNVDIKRDFGYAPKYVEAIHLMMQQDKARDYVICSGKSVLLRDIIYHVFDYLSISRDRIIIDEELRRPLDINDIYGDSTKAKNLLRWKYDMSFFEVLDILIKEELRG